MPHFGGPSPSLERHEPAAPGRGSLLAHLEAASHPLDSVYLHGEPAIGSRHSDTTWQNGIGFGWSRHRSSGSSKFRV
ncbi:hypothetical protein [Streptomyces zagrosensis]|uniref:Uncharacterized protein n=1 Tax=Streptomyces zagrosensis TaxID=1042984 RepID=A0A7W9UYY4_9ACTN|nr:hypothetical protein [Streptomyces zagrosensis]MBB5936182.1 hypothetical protein [Streptomyces zagrosensis]